MTFGEFVIELIILALLFYYCMIIVPRKSHKKRLMEKAFKITRIFGSKDIECVSVKSSDGSRQRHYYIAEVDAFGHYQMCVHIGSSHEDAHPDMKDKNIRKDIDAILDYLQIAYDHILSIHDTDKTQYELFGDKYIKSIL